MAHKKGGGTTRNGRDSESKRLGVKVYGGQSINAGGIINVLRHIENADDAEINSRIDAIPARLSTIWSESDSTSLTPAEVADNMAQKLIGRL